MDSLSEVHEHGSVAKRLKLDTGVLKNGELCGGETPQFFSTSTSTPSYGLEGMSTDYDSGCGTSILGTTPIPSLQTSPNTDSQDTFSDSSQTPVYIGSMNISQESTDNTEDNVSTISRLSDLSGLSELSGQDWKPMAGSMIWIQKQMQSGVNPRALLGELGVDSEQIPEHVDDFILWKIIINMLAEPPQRNKLRHVNTLEDIVRLIKGAQNIIVLTGAGVSVSCGIPDFRSRDGIYSRLAVDFPDLPDPQAMFDISYFSQDPRPFYKFARDIYPGKFTPSPCHRFIKLIEKQGKLLRNYTQNIDTLERIASIEKVIECHGSFATATCTKCSCKVTADEIRDCILSQSIPLCPKCHEGKKQLNVPAHELNELQKNYRFLVSSGIMKPDIVFFGEGLPDTFHHAMADDKSKCDLLLVIGSSLKVRPVALIPSSIPPDIPQILINREPLPHCHFDVELLGDCDVIINHLCQLLGGSWEEVIYDKKVLQHAPLLPLTLQSQTIGEHNEIEISSSFIKVKNNEPKNLSANNVRNPCTNYMDSDCRCNTYNKNLHNKEIVEGDSKSIKERHASIDSARDSGIGENSNFTDIEGKFDDSSQDDFYLNVPSSSTDYNKIADTSGSSQIDMKGYWQPKIKKSLADRLPSNSFHLIPPSRYIFPGAEVFYDPDEKLDDEENTTTSESSEYDSDNESQTNEM